MIGYYIAMVIGFVFGYFSACLMMMSKKIQRWMINLLNNFKIILFNFFLILSVIICVIVIFITSFFIVIFEYFEKKLVSYLKK